MNKNEYIKNLYPLFRVQECEPFEPIGHDNPNRLYFHYQLKQFETQTIKVDYKNWINVQINDFWVEQNPPIEIIITDKWQTFDEGYYIGVCFYDATQIII